MILVQKAPAISVDSLYMPLTSCQSDKNSGKGGEADLSNEFYYNFLFFISPLVLL